MSGLIKRKRDEDRDDDVEVESRRNRRWKADIEEDMDRLTRSVANVGTQVTDVKEMMRTFFTV